MLEYSTEYPFEISSWQENNDLIIFSGFRAKRPPGPFGCLVAPKHLHWFKWLLITALAFSEGSELFLASKDTDCPDRVDNR